MIILGQIIKWILLIVLFFLLTLLSQVGGVILLLYWPVSRYLVGRIQQRRWRLIVRPVGYLVFHILFISFLLPPLASMGGRVPLPLRGDHVRPLNALTFFLSRNYVTPAHRVIVSELGQRLSEKAPGYHLAYMDAQYPFSVPLPYLGRSLPPHITHNDGRRLDIALLYQDAETKAVLPGESKTAIGYGSFEVPQQGERDRPAECTNQGFWIYSFMSRKLSQASGVELNESATAAFMRIILEHPRIERIYLEPHLVQRFKLTSGKIGLASCASVRHDDHVHIRTTD